LCRKDCYEAHAKELKEYQKKYNADHAEELKKYKDEHRAIKKEYNKAYRAKHRTSGSVPPHI
jgi:hypothetical protein